MRVPQPGRDEESVISRFRFVRVNVREKQQMPCEAKAAKTTQPDALWKLIMTHPQPADLLRTILDEAAARAEIRPVEVTADGRHAIVLQGCTVTIYQQIAPPTEPDLRAL